MSKIREVVTTSIIPCPNCDGQGAVGGFKEVKGKFSYAPKKCTVCLGEAQVVRVHEICYGNDVYYLKPCFEGSTV